MPNVDMIWGFSLEYMHNSLLGVAEQMWDYWVKNNCITAEQRRDIDNDLLLINPPRELFRAPTKISNKSVWKASDWKSWLIYYSIPILMKYLDKELLQHYALFVNSICVLLKTNISESELQKCEDDLIEFVGQYQSIYSLKKMTFNVHILSHLVMSVRYSGPLWATSAFPFESNIYNLKEMINGPKNVEQQMAKKSLIRLQYYIKPKTNNLKEESVSFCKRLFITKPVTESALKIENILLLGPSLKNKFQEEKEFHRCIVDKSVYSSTTYLRTKKFNDTVIELKNGNIIQITKIKLTTDNKVLFENRRLLINPFYVNEVAISHIWEVTRNVDNAVITISDFHRKVVVLEFDNKHYVCLIPNAVEAQ